MVRFGDQVFREGQGFSERDTEEGRTQLGDVSLGEGGPQSRADFSGGGGSSVGSDGLTGQERAKKQGQEQAARDKIIAEQSLIEQTRQQGLARLESQRIEEVRGQAAKKEIIEEKQRIESEGGQTTTTQSVDVKTGDKLKITTTRGSGGRTIRTTENVETGVSRTNVFAPGRGGGGVRQVGGITEQTPITPQQELARADAEGSDLTKQLDQDVGNNINSLDNQKLNDPNLFGSLLRTFNRPFKAAAPGIQKVQTLISRVAQKEIRLPIFGGTGVSIPISKVKSGLGREFGVTGGVVAEFIPQTVGESALVAGSVLTLKALPAIGRIGSGLGFGALGTKTALDTELKTEQRIAGGIIGGLGFAGAGLESLPFIKGGFARLSTKFKPVKTQTQGFKAVSTEKPIGLILEKAPAKTGKTAGVKLPKTSQLKRGGFGVKQSEKGLFIGKDQQLATSQVGFFKEGQDISLTREFFVTPQEPTLKIPTARVSRLALTDPFKFPKGAKIGFGIPKTPQIGVTTGAVSKGGSGTSFKIGAGSELEGIIGAGRVITGVKKTGVTVIRGQKVDLFSFLSGGKAGLKTGIPKTPSTLPTTTIQGETILSSLGVRSLTRPTKTQTTAITTRVTPLISSPRATSTRATSITRVISSPSLPSSGRGSIPKVPSTPLTPVIRQPSIPKVPSTPLTPVIRQPSIPKIPSTPLTPTTRPPRRPPSVPKIPILSISASAKIPKKSFGVQIRRAGKFFSLGRFKTQSKAISVGKRATEQSLAATFRLTTPGKIPKNIKGFRTKAQKGLGTLFIERRSRRLKRRGVSGEVREILGFKLRSRKKKTKRKKKK